MPQNKDKTIIAIALVIVALAIAIWWILRPKSESNRLKVIITSKSPLGTGMAVLRVKGDSGNIGGIGLLWENAGYYVEIVPSVSFIRINTMWVEYWIPTEFRYQRISPIYDYNEATGLVIYAEVPV